MPHSLFVQLMLVLMLVLKQFLLENFLGIIGLLCLFFSKISESGFFMTFKFNFYNFKLVFGSSGITYFSLFLYSKVIIDHCVHLYDIRQPGKPLNVFRGHKKAVSYVKYANEDEVISA